MSTVYCSNCSRVAVYTDKGRRYCLPCLNMLHEGRKSRENPNNVTVSNDRYMTTGFNPKEEE